VARLAYLGPPGTFGEEAALSLEPSADLVPHPSHSAVVAAVAARDCELGVAAIENSLEGSVPETLDALIANQRVAIRAELAIPIRHCLLVAPDAGVDVEVIYSHPQALGQCRRFIESRFPTAVAEAALSTASAVQEMLKRPRAAAIGTERAATLYGARVLERDIQDDASNTTRFVVLGTEDAAPTGDDKTSMFFSTPDKPGALVRALQEFAARGINLTKIESRPAKERLGVYVFLVDVEGHRTDALVAEALDDLRAQTVGLRIFGSYPVYRGMQKRSA
jgi:prephenate dehydratase